MRRSLSLLRGVGLLASLPEIAACELDFFSGFDGDCLRGVVTGTLRPSTPGAPDLGPPSDPPPDVP